MVCLVLIWICVFVCLSGVSSVFVILLFIWYLMLMVFWLLVGNEIFGLMNVVICFGIFKWIKFVVVRIIVLYWLLLSLVKWVLMLLCKLWIFKLGCVLWIWYWWCKFDVLIIVFCGNLFKFL